MTVSLQVFQVASPARSTYAAPVLPGQFGLALPFRVMLVRVPVHGMQGPLEKQKHIKEEKTLSI
jgi:hypothetical protein